jgi:hypothetical protein
MRLIDSLIAEGETTYETDLNKAVHLSSNCSVGGRSVLLDARQDYGGAKPTDMAALRKC